MAHRSPSQRTCLIISFLFISILFVASLSIMIAALNSSTEFEDSMKENKGWMEKFAKIPDPEQAKEHLKTLTSKPHLAGTKADEETADWFFNKCEEFGLPKREKQELEVMLSYPAPDQGETELTEELNGHKWKASLEETDDDGKGARGENEGGERRRGGRNNNKSDEFLIPFNGYSASGHVSSALVYANYGTRQDFQELKDAGVTIEGNIVIVRYGKIYRGDKVALAEEFGAIGCIIYSDPSDDGADLGHVYPKGPFRPENGVQRGTVFTGSGDPSTPGWPSTKDAPRLTENQVKDPAKTMFPLPKIPVLPISWKNAKHLLGNLSNPDHTRLPPGFDKGAKGFKYHTGPGLGVVTLKVYQELKLTKIWNVICSIPGKEDPDHLVLLGNHRDAWVYGASDPSSGTATMTEVARSFGELYRQGWRPKRTVAFASWDAEEYGLVGSVEFVEQYAPQLLANAVVYLNCDSAIYGVAQYFEGYGTPSVGKVAEEVVKSVLHPNGGKIEWSAADMGRLGEGSDQGAFINHIGVPAFDFGFVGERGQGSGTYHSIFDNFDLINRVNDPEFKFHKAAAQVFGLLAMRFASDPVVPLDFEGYANDLARVVKELDKEEKYSFKVDFEPLHNAIHALSHAAGDALHGASVMNKSSLRRLNDRLIRTERAFLNTQVSGHAWYKHVIWAVDTENRYAGAEFPSLGRALNSGEADANAMVKHIAILINQAAEVLKDERPW